MLIFRGSRLCLLLGCLVLFATAAFAYPPPDGKGGGGGKNNPSLLVQVSPENVSERDPGAIGTVTRQNSDTTVALSVTLESSDTSEATVEASVEIPVGQVSSDFLIFAEDDTVKDGDQTVTISASATDHSGGSASLTVVDDDVLPPIVYLESTVSLPIPFAANAALNGFNDLGMICGYYSDSGGSPNRSAYLYDPYDPGNPSTAVDLNTLDVAGLDSDWFFRSAVGLNNNGLIVGYIALKADYTVRRGFVLDLAPDPEDPTAIPQVHLLPDTGRGWLDTLATNVNDNGDILGMFDRADGTTGAYLYNPGLRGAVADDLIEINVNIETQLRRGLSNPPAGEPAKVVLEVVGGGIATYVRGGQVEFNSDLSLTSPCMNSNGDIAARGTITKEVQINKKKTETVTTQVIYREMDGVEERIESGMGTMDINDSGTVLILDWSLYHGPFRNGFYHDDWGFVDLRDIAGPSNLLSADDSVVSKSNESGILGFTEILGGGVNPDTGELELYILRPHEITP